MEIRIWLLCQAKRCVSVFSLFSLSECMFSVDTRLGCIHSRLCTKGLPGKSSPAITLEARFMDEPEESMVDVCSSDVVALLGVH